MGTEMRFTYARDYGRVHDLQKSDPRFYAMAESAMMKAIGYGWGRTDAPGFQWPEHKGDALDFGVAYAIHYTSPGTIHGLREAYKKWYETGDIA